MPMTLEQAQKTTARLSDALLARRPRTAKELSYYRGDQGELRFASPKFSENFRKQFEGFSDNWCAPVADASPERMVLLGIRPYGTIQADKETNRAWEAADAAAGMQTALQVRAAARRAFALIAPGKRPDRPRITFENPEQVYVDSDPATRERRSALVTWADDKKEYATLYLPDEIWKFERETSEERWQRQGRPADLFQGWEPRVGDTHFWGSNPFGEVPVVELRNRDLLDDEPISDIAGVMAMQDAINLIWAYLINALDAASLPQRIVTGAEPPKIPILDQHGQQIGARPVELDKLLGEKVLFVPGENVGVAEWSRSQLGPFSEVINQAIEHIAAQTRTPPHYLMTKMVNTAAEALTISEAGLVSKTRQSVMHVNSAVREIYKLMAIAMDRPSAEVDALAAGRPMWADIQYRSEAQRADALVKKRQMGYPLRWIFEQDGASPEEIERIMEMIREERAQDALAADHFATTTAMNPALDAPSSQLME